MAAVARYTRRVWKSFLDNGGHETAVFPLLKLDSISPGRVLASLNISDHNLNRGKILHGGVILSLTDTMGSLVIATKGQWMTGVSTDIGATFVRPGGKLGESVTIEGKLTAIGGNMAFTRIEFRDKEGKLVAYGNHTKFIGKTINHPKNVKFSDNGERVIEGEDLLEDVD
ncbi:Thioesterase/thiol ester dehydrase-isomerase [Serendipita vermifera]|nr:Thioesterase/thiol ester dehydrase-isomerase [Serendipita vermifera]